MLKNRPAERHYYTVLYDWHKAPELVKENFRDLDQKVMK